MNDDEPKTPQADSTQEPEEPQADGALELEAPPEEPRRRFLHRVCLGLGATSACAVSAPAAGFVLAPLVRKDDEVWRNVGKVNDFTVGTTVKVEYENPDSLPWSGVSSHTAAWLRREADNKYTAFSLNCTHLGCPVRWVASADLFMCPCHGGVYYPDGRVAAGPPPLPLPRYPVRVQDGLVQVQTSPIPLTTLRSILRADRSGRR